MENLESGIFLFLWIVLTIAMWILYHKIFTVYYAGSPFHGIVKELIYSFITSAFIASFIWLLFKNAVLWIVRIGGVVIKWTLIILAVCAVIYAIAWLIGKIRGKYKEQDDADDTTGEQTQHENENTSDDIRQGKEEKDAVNDNVGKSDDESDIADYIKEHFKDQKIAAIKYYREKTGADFNEAKRYIDNLFK